MKSDIIIIDNQGNGFAEAVEQTKAFSERCGELNPRNALRLQLITEEMLSLARSVTGEMKASFWIEGEGSRFTLTMTTKTVMDKEKRAMLIMSATSRKNEAAKGFLGKLRDVFEQAMVSEPKCSEGGVPYELRYDVASDPYENAEWDGYERSILKKLADDVKIGIRGGVVEMTVSKNCVE